MLVGGRDLGMTGHSALLDIARVVVSGLALNWIWGLELELERFGVGFEGRWSRGAADERERVCVCVCG